MSRFTSQNLSMFRVFGTASIVVAMAFVCAPAFAQPGGGGTPWPPTGVPPSVNINTSGIGSLLNGGLPGVPNFTPFTNIEFSSTVPVQGDAQCSIGINPQIPGLLLRDPRVRLLPVDPALPPRLIFGGPTDDCSLGLLIGIPGLAEFDPVGFRLMGNWDGTQTTDGCRLIFGPTNDCRIEINPLFPDGLRLYDPIAVRICNPIPDFPTFLRFGPTDDCSISVDPQNPGMRLSDPIGIRILQPDLAGPPARLIFGPDPDNLCAFGLLLDIPGLAEFDPVGLRLMGNWDGQQTTNGCRLIFGPTDDCRIEIDPLAMDGLRLYDPNSIRICNPFPNLPTLLRFGPTDDCSLGIDPQTLGLIVQDAGGLVIRNIGSSGKDGVDVRLRPLPAITGRSGLRVSNLGSSGKDGVSIDLGETGDCRLEAAPDLGLRLYDPAAIRICNPNPVLPPRPLWWGPDNLCGIWPAPGLGMRLYDVDGIRICAPLPGLPLPPLFFGDNNQFQLQASFGPGSEPFFNFNQIVMAPDFIETSSQRWKTNIATIEKPLEKIQSLRGVSFDWDEAHGGKASIGLIAEEVGAVIPELVLFEADGTSAAGVKYNNLVGLLIEGIKQQQEQIKDHGEAVKTLQAENAELKALVAENIGQSERTDQLEGEVQQLRDQLGTLLEALAAQQK